MTLSIADRRKNLDAALISLVDSLGEGHFADLVVIPSDYSDVLPTSWTEMTKRGLLEDYGANVEAYRLTKYGYVRGLQESGRSHQPRFRKLLGKVCRVLKGVPDRQDQFWPYFVL